jgi:sec-independent protein translocase protein TatA
MFGISLTHWLLFIIVMILLFGAKRLPDVAGAMGKSIKAFKRGYNEGAEGPEGKEGKE